MGYKGHPGWTDGDVGNVPDRNPRLSCDGCDESALWQSIKNGDWQISNDPTEPLLCPECADEPVGVHSDEERRARNHSIDAYSGSSGPGTQRGFSETTEWGDSS